MDPQHLIIGTMFDTLTGGMGNLMTDFRVGLVSVGGCLLIIFALNIIIKVIYGTAPSRMVADRWAEGGKELEYETYRKKRAKSERNKARYDSDPYATSEKKSKKADGKGSVEWEKW